MVPAASIAPRPPSEDPDRGEMTSLRYLIAAVLILVGGIFLGQGLGFIGGSRMTNDPFWAIVGAVMILVGAAVLFATWRARRA